MTNLIDKDLLKRFTPFDGLQDEYLDEVITSIKLSEAPKGTMLFKRGRASGLRFFLLEGVVDLIDSQYVATSIRGGSTAALSALNKESPTQSSCVVKDQYAQIFSIEVEVLDRIMAWSESAESAFAAEMDAKYEADFNPASTGQFDVVDVGDDLDNDWMSSLLKTPMMARVPLTHVQDLFTRFEDVRFKAGDVIMKEGEQGDYFYVLSSGTAKITNKSESVDVELRPGQYFGEEALLASTLRNATVTMMKPGMLKRLNSEDFKSLLSEPVLQYVTGAELGGFEKPHKLIDVKMPLEYRAAHIKGSINVPLARLRGTMPELARTNVYVVNGDAGSRANIAAHLLCQAGFDAFILLPEDPAEERLEA
ncbi:MAG: CRP-like cAMP-binding protein [Flavobacteriales bacterium]|jgi:CRP-like cAMP-binding protein